MQRTAKYAARLLSAAARAMSPSNGLRFLLGVEQALYPVIGQLAVAHGKGIHPKHRLTRYHDFFVKRICDKERVLDLGCGNGAMAHDVASRTGATVTGIDHDTRKIADANQLHRHDRVTYILGDLSSDCPRQRFDVVMLSNVLEHLDGRSELLLRVARLVRPKKFLIRVPLFERDWRVPLKKELGLEWRLDVTHQIEYTLETFAAEMNTANLAIVSQEVRWGELWAEVRPARRPSGARKAR